MGAVLRCSPRYESEPWGFAGSRRFLNIGVEIQVEEPPLQLLRALQEIERGICAAPHRDATGGYIDRVVDIDLIYYDDLVIDTPELQLPHPRLHLRPFVLIPLKELSRAWRHPLGL